jgi:hypothetical protein
LNKGDKNTRFFHKFASQRRSQNTIWDITNEDGSVKSTDKEIKETTFKHFQSQYNALEAEDTRNQLNILKDVPRFFNNDESDDIGKPNTLEEIDCYAKGKWRMGYS